MATRPTLTLAYLTHAPDAAAEVLAELPAASAAAFLENVPARLAATVVERMSPWHAARVLELMPMHQAAAVLQQVPFHDGVGLMRLVPSGLHVKLFEEFPARRAQRMKQALRYPVGTVGAWLDPDIPAFPGSATVGEALRYLRHCEDDNHVFLQADESGTFLGAVPVGRLLRHDEATILGDLSRDRLTPLSSRASLASAAGHPDWDRYLVLPVIGRGRSMVGGLSRASLKRGLNERAPADATAQVAMPVRLLAMLGVVCAGILRALSGARPAATVHEDPRHV